MSYDKDIFHFISEKSYLDSPPVKGREFRPDEHGYEFVRFGDTRKVFDHKKCAKDVATLIRHYDEFGYGDRIPVLEDHELRKAVAKFRATLDCWELISISKVFSKDEIYYRCISEGPSFASFIKKSRATTLRGLTSITETEVEEEYFHPENYEGYDSILSERNLIHWSEKEGLDDVKYAFMPATGEQHDFGKLINDFLDSLKLDPNEFVLELDTLSTLRNTKMVDVKTSKTSLMREFWTEEIDFDQPYFAKRSIVEIEPGNIRDTGIGDASTIAKIKIINALCKVILAKCTHSANCDAETSTRRLARILQRNCYLHLDFKKYGLAFPRVLQNLALQAIGRKYNIDVSFLLIDEFYIEIDKKTYRTERGIVLGWLDCLNEICVHAILSSINKQGVAFDWIQFNDDVEISIYCKEEFAAERLEVVRDVVLSTLHTYDILISISKTYGSLASVFLEKYFRFKEQYGLDMTKRQLSCRPYAKSLIATEPWVAKMQFAIGYELYENDKITNRCITTSKIEFCPNEVSASLLCGGWFPKGSSKLDRSLEGQDPELVSLACELMQIRLPDISSKVVAVSKPEEQRNAKIEKVLRSDDSSEGRKIFDMRDTRFDVNFEIEGVFLRYNYQRTQRLRHWDLDSAAAALMDSLSKRVDFLDNG